MGLTTSNALIAIADGTGAAQAQAANATANLTPGNIWTFSLQSIVGLSTAEIELSSDNKTLDGIRLQWTQGQANSLLLSSPVAPSMTRYSVSVSDGKGSTAYVTGRLSANTASAASNPYLAQAAWYISPAAGNDGNDGATASTPLRTYAELVRRWGTNAPALGACTITFLTSHTDATDPVVCNPIINVDDTTIFTNVFILQGILGAAQRVGTGTMTLVAAKAAPATYLTVTLPAAASGSYAVGQLIVNTTHASKAHLKALVGGTTWTITQPLTGYSTTYAGGAAPHMVDTWATSDVVTVYDPVAINIVEVDARASTIIPGIEDYAFVSQCRIWTNGEQSVRVGKLVDFYDVVSDRILECATGIAAVNSFFINTFSGMGVSGGQPFTEGFVASPNLIGGMYGGDTVIGFVSVVKLVGCVLDCDVIIAQNFAGFPATLGAAKIGAAYIDASTIANLSGACVVSPGPYSAIARVRGAGKLNAVGATRVAYASDTAVNIFQLSGGLQANGVATASSFAAGAINTGITLTPAHMDAAAGAAGFGGNAFNLGGASYVAGAI